jgi:hypothetical protein
MEVENANIKAVIHILSVMISRLKHLSSILSSEDFVSLQNEDFSSHQF